MLEWGFHRKLPGDRRIVPSLQVGCSKIHFAPGTPMPRVHISAEGNTPHPSVKRRHGRTNLGLYCLHCGEFFALAVHDRELGVVQLEFISDGEPLFECPLCHQQQRRQVSEIAEIVLTEATKRRPQRPEGLN